MQRNEFEYLYIHANCLADLAIQQFAAQFEEDLVSNTPEPSELSAEEMEERVHAQLAQLDLASMSDGMPWDSPESDAAVLGEFNRLQQEGETATEPLDELTITPLGQSCASSAQAPNGDFNHEVSLYLERAYEARAEIASQVDEAINLVDMVRIKSLLESLPQEHPSLTGPLNAEEFAFWLSSYGANHPVLSELVVLIREVVFKQ